jgi:lipoyl(octanoyl) transferase
VLTLGRSAHEENLLAPREFLASRGVAVVETERGGDVTYHGPGQLVAYPIFSLAPDRQDVRRYVKDLVRVMALLCADHGVGAGGRDDLIGAWVDLDDTSHWRGAAEASRPAKIGAIGVKISRWVTMHGFALNATTALSDCAMIVPCGIAQHPVTSLEALGVTDVPSVRALAARAVTHFATIFDATAEDLREGPPILDDVPAEF